MIDERWEFELAAAREDLGRLAVAIDTSMAQGRRPISVLTRCAAALPTIPIVMRHRPDACVVWFDAHADLNTPSTTPSSYLGGMALAGVTGLWNSGFGAGLDLSQVILVGTREIDAPEQAVLDTHHVTVVPVQEGVAGALARAVAGRPTYVHLDCDVLEPGLVPTDYAVQGGLSLAQLREACAAIAMENVVGIEIAEFEYAGRRPRGCQGGGAAAGRARATARLSRRSQVLALHHFPRRRDLAGMSRGVFGDVEDQPDHRGRQLGAADGAWLQQRRHIGCLHLREGAVDAGVGDGEGLVCGCRWQARLALGLHPGQLCGCERFTTRVRQQPVGGAGDVSKVETDGPRIAGSRPQLLGREVGSMPLHFLAHLQERMNDGLQFCRVAFDGTAQPHLGKFVRHGGQCTGHRGTASS